MDSRRLVSFSEMEYHDAKNKTTIAKFLAKMDKYIAIDEWCEILRPYYHTTNKTGRPAYPLEVMLRMYLVSQWYSLSDKETQDALTENLSVREYVGIHGEAPDETTLCRFRHFIEKHKLAKKMFDYWNNKMDELGAKRSGTTILDSTIEESPKSKKNKSHQRTPEMAATTKNGEHHYGSKTHIGIDGETGLVHSVVVTPANVNDVDEAGELVIGDEQEVYADAGYIGMEKKAGVCEKFQDGSGRVEWVQGNKSQPRHLVCVKHNGVKFYINKKRSTVKTEEEKAEEKRKSKKRAKVEHIFATVKQKFKCRKIPYRSLEKVETKMIMLITLANVLTYSKLKEQES